MVIFFWPGPLADPRPGWTPRADVYRCPEGWVLKLDLAGVDAGDISVQVRGSQVKISGARRDRVLQEGWRCHSIEISYNRFERVIDLGSPLDAEHWSAQWDQGMLLVHVKTKDEP